MNNRTETLKTTPEIELLIQPISKTDYSALESSVFANGCLEPITIWNNIIVDGHKRYDICCRRNLPFSTRSIPFKEMCDVISHVCMQQLHREDLTLEYHKYLIGRLYYAEAEIAARNFLLTTDNQRKKVNSSPSPPNKYATAMQIGADYHISHGTVLKYSVYTKSLDNIRAKEVSLFSRILMGKLKISHENVIEVSRLPKEDLRCLITVLDENNIERIGYSEIRHELQWKRIPTFPPKEEAKCTPGIRKMPKYDPDADISSLTLTIPSWISSIERSRKNTNFNMISATASQELLCQLNALKRAIQNIENAIKEER